MFRSIGTVIKECWINRNRMIAVSAYNLSFQYNQTKLKLLWTIINPILQALTYWVVFYIGMRSNPEIEGVSYLCWMLTGLVPWFYMSLLMMNGANSIITSAGILKFMNYPVSIIPVSTVCTEFMTHIIYMVVLVGIQILSGIRYGFGLLYIIYFFICEFFFFLGYTFLFSTITVFIRDIPRMVSPLVRLLFFLTPVCWTASGTALESVEKWNPLFYIIEGFRGSMLHNGNFSFENWQHLYFWGITLVMLFLGCWLHNKLKPTFADYI